MKRIIDIVNSIFGLLLLSPVFLVVTILIILEDGGPVFFRQTRVGKNGRTFNIHKFRTMRKDAEKLGLQITIGNRDHRVTRVGYHLRRFKIDELPQLLDVLAGSMSFVGPRPEVPRYVTHYTPEQRAVLSVSPGITDWASIAFRNENELLAESQDPEYTYLNEILPAKIELNLSYIKNNSLLIDLHIVLRTIIAILGIEKFLPLSDDSKRFFGSSKQRKP